MFLLHSEKSLVLMQSGNSFHFLAAKYVKELRPKVVVLGLQRDIEMITWRTLGDFLDGSGWTSAIMQANVASSGTADSFLKASHVSRTRHAHQVTACGLHILMCRAYDEYVEGLSESDTKLEFHQWQDYKSSSCPQFKYWSMVLKIELTILLFVRSLREGREEEATLQNA